MSHGLSSQNPDRSQPGRSPTPVPDQSQFAQADKLDQNTFNLSEHSFPDPVSSQQTDKSSIVARDSSTELIPRGKGLRAAWNELWLDSIHKTTGLEKMPLQSFIANALAKNLFPHTKDPVFQTATWSILFEKEIVGDRSAKPIFELLKSRLRGRPLIELGVGKGEDVAAHRRVVTKKFEVSDYLAVDRQSTIKEFRGIQDDALNFLARQPSGSSNIVAFGLFNEPLGLRHSQFWRAAEKIEYASRSHYEHEYVRRISAEIARVIPEDGTFFGQGIHPTFGFVKEEHIVISMRRAGLVNWQEADQALAAISNKVWGITDPFCLVKNKS